MLIGTHALLEDRVKFKNLGLAIIDEQHRFGVAQRSKLWHKNESPPHILVMTATPIPRTLAMSVYGDLDISIIDELPPGRKPVKTVHRYDKNRLKVFAFLKEEIKKGAHINAIGSFQPHMQELDPYLIRDAKVYVDQAAPCLKESGDFIKPILEGIISEKHIMGEISDFCLNKIPGRESGDEITLFKSVGVAIQDYAVATDIYNASLTTNFGQEINFFE